MASSNYIQLDLEACQERFSLYNLTMPQRKVSQLFEFDPNATPNENLDLLSKMALKDEFTVPFIFIYRPIFIELVARWITVSSTSDAVDVIAAFGRSITLCPEIATLAELFLKERSDFFNALLLTDQVDEILLHKVLLGYYRLIYHDKARFKIYINAQTIYSLLSSKCGNVNSKIGKFLSVKIISALLNMAEAAYIKLLQNYIPIEEPILFMYECSPGVDYKFLELNEAKRFSNFSKLPQVHPADFVTEQNKFKGISKYFIADVSNLSPHVVPVCNVLIPRVNSFTNHTSYTSELVHTDNSVQAMIQLAFNVQKSKPVMVLGKCGSGKTFLINELAKMMGMHHSMVKIHLGEQTDAKLLLGTYTSGERPGTFEWRTGVLTTAVKEGRWVLIEDIDKAPTEVLSVLLTLLEKNVLSIPSRGELIKAANGFQLLSTITIDESEDRKHGESYRPDLIGIARWEVVHLQDLSNVDLHSILCQKYPILQSMIPKFIQTYYSVKKIYTNPGFISLNKGVVPRVISVRDLVKLCNRVNSLFTNHNVVKHDQLIESYIYNYIFSEAVDCFASAVSENSALQLLVTAVGESLEIPSSRVSLYMSKYVPEFEHDADLVKIGRAELPISRLGLQKKSVNITSFAKTNHSLRLMEQIGVAAQMAEPVLLVGETGTGKTTVVQHVAKLMNKPLTVINVSQQTEAGDLLGGFKPVNCKTVAIPILEDFEALFSATFSMKKNERFYQMVHKCFTKNQWKNIIKLWNEAVKMAKSILSRDSAITNDAENKKKRRKLDSNEKKQLLNKWQDFHETVKKFELQSKSIENSFVFDFVEGSLVKAIKNGSWLLLDEINLASSDTLESITDLLTEKASRSILLSEKGEVESVKAHSEFRIFACMNPATDVGKKDLPSGIRSRFTEIYVHSPDRDITDLLSIIDKYIGRYSVSDEWVGNDIAQLYLEAKKLAETNSIVDGSNQKPHFSIRTLSRTLIYVCDIIQIYGLRRSLYEGFCMSFLTLLDQKSESILLPLIEKYTLGRLKNAKSVISQTPPSPGPNYVKFRHYWMECGSEQIVEQPHYIITPFVEKNMLNLVRATSGRRFPVLVQGPTSAGKTSMIKYLADITGHKFVRINNHEHTDLQEYLGSYVTDDTGKLSFKEGVLVEALRKGHWIVLDELNLAPSDVLEALNRLLDDNRELFIPETQEVIHPHPDFMLFATQNPPGIYGGRKLLSRAFRNRFLELHFDDIPQNELETILRERCQIAPSYARKIVEVYCMLTVQRSANRLFEQKNSFATLRDLFRWALREAVGYEQLAVNGYMLLAERCRTQNEKALVKSVIEKVMKVQLDMDKYYKAFENDRLMEMNSPIVWTNAMRRLSVLVSACLKNNEPVLLVGETGCGKTTICQLLSQFMNKQLITMNAHQNTETGDIIGAQRPVRNRSELQEKLSTSLRNAIPSDLLGDEKHDLNRLLELYRSMDKSDLNSDLQNSIKRQLDELNILFEWCDGPLIQAMKKGEFFLLDEISLADDSVLERLNSVLEPERSLLLAEKGCDSSLTAIDGFQFFATMNPGGDYGKRELSPALRNRLTEIWVPSMESFSDVSMIVSTKLLEPVGFLTKHIVKFSEWYGNKFGGRDATNGVISLRDILAWVEFINCTYMKVHDPHAALVHGAAMVFIDALGTNNTAYLAENEARLHGQKVECIELLSEMTGDNLFKYLSTDLKVEVTDQMLKCGLFDVARSTANSPVPTFNLSAPTTMKNLMKVMRAMQVQKPILLEGSPGVGKTSLISALADCTGNNLTRMNLSEQTDLVDLFGSDAPGENTGEFVWRDAPFLRAMQRGEWVLLDEMNLASQSVLEGLNACLDHRGEVYIPELDKSFIRHPNFMVFAAQNPQYQGGGRKGLPKSFINRFSVVYMDTLTADDLLLISKHLYPNISSDTCKKMIKVISSLEDEVTNRKMWGSAGAPWEFNLRDTLRWLRLLNSKSICNSLEAFDFVDMIVSQRFRCELDHAKAHKLITNVFGNYSNRDNYYQVTQDYLQVNAEVVKRNKVLQFSDVDKLVPLQSNYTYYESILRCLNHNWPVILVGPSNAGKTELIHFLANVLGSEVVEFAMNSDVDSMDLLGGYEQVDLTRKISEVVDRLSLVLRELLVINLSNRFEESQTESNQIALHLFEFIQTRTITLENFDLFLEHFSKFMSFVGDNHQLNEIQNDFIQLSLTLKREVNVRFEWFDGLLVKAVERGSWLILDNANLCSPSVLDRLNSLLEVNGNLVINECSLSDGRPRVVQPHPNFRLFLTVDPKYGELSRAMRNRGIEIYVDDLKVRASEFDRSLLGYNLKDSSKMQLENGIKAISLSDNCFNRPLQSYTSHSNSVIVPFARLHDILLSSNNNISTSVITTLPLISSFFIELWNNNVLANKDFEEKDIVSKISAYHDFLNQFNIIENVKELYQSTSDKYHEDFQAIRFPINQTLLPVLNVYISDTLLAKSAISTSSETLYLYQLMEKLLFSVHSLQFTNKKSTHGKIHELSYLEQSAAVYNNRKIKNPPKIRIFELLLELNNFTQQCLTDIPLFDLPNVYNMLFKLYIIWIGAFEVSSTRDETRLRVYQELLITWSDEAKLTVPNVTEVSAMSHKFGSSLDLKTGKSMTLIWEEFRKRYPSSLEAWSKFIKIENVAAQFDSVTKEQFCDSYPIIRNLHHIFHCLVNDLLTGNDHDFDEVISKIERGLLELNAISNSFLTKRNHQFREDFTTIFRFIFCDNNGCASDLVSEIAPSSSIPVMKLSRLNNKSYVFPPTFDITWNKDGDRFVSHTGELFNTSLLESVLEKTNSLQSAPGSQLTQMISDANLLIKAMTNASQFLLGDQCKLYRDILVDWYKKIVKIHISSDLDNLCMEDIFRLVDNGIDADFASIHQKFLSPAILLVNDNPSMNSLGKAWVLFATGLIQLYVPSSPLDPAIRDYVLLDHFMKRKQESERLINTWKTVRTILTGSSEMEVEKLIDVVTENDGPEKPKVFRPNHPIDTLFDEWSAFMVSTVDSENLQRLLDAADHPSEFNKLVMFQQNTSQFLSRLSESYKYYSDLTEIFAGYVYSLKFGYDLLVYSTIRDHKPISLSPLCAIDLNVISNIDTIGDCLQDLCTFFKSKTIESLDVESILIYYMKLVRYHALDDKLLNILGKILHSLYYRWTLRHMKDEKLNADRANIFRYKDESENVESEFKRMFPDYEDVLSLDASEEATLSSNDNLDELYYNIAKSYIDLFSDSPNFNISPVIREGSKVTSMLLKDSHKFKSEKMNATSFTATVNLLASEVESLGASLEPPDVNFYHGYSVQEARKSMNIIENLLNSINGLLIQWPEHSTLVELFRICKEYLQYPVNTPVARLLQKIEQTYTFVSEWEKYAASSVSLSSHIKAITTLIVDWRKWELHTWNSLFTFEEKSFEKKIGNLWFHLFEVIIIANFNPQDGISKELLYSRLMASLTLFFSKSTYGEFSIRIKLVEAFEKHVSIMTEGKSEVLHVLQNAVTFFKQFSSIIEEKVLSVRKSLEKDISEVILLASWKDVNVDALKQSSRRSHNNLYKLVRKYREALSNEVSMIIESGLSSTHQDFHSLDCAIIPSSRELDLQRAKLIVEKLPTWETRPKALKNVQLVERNMIIYRANITKQEIPDIYEYIKLLVKEAERLREETPKVYSKDKKKLLATLKTQKYKLLSDTLKELKRIGLKTSFREDVHKLQSSVTSILASVKSFKNTKIFSCDFYFFKTLDLIPRLRSAASSPAGDIPVADIEKGLAIGENLIFSLIKTREPMFRLVTDCERLEKLRKYLEEVSGSKIIKNISLKNKFNLAVYYYKWLPSILQFAIDTLQSISSRVSYNLDICFLQQAISSINDFKGLENKYCVLGREAEILLSELESFLNRLLSELRAYKDKDCFFVYEVVISWIESQHFTANEEKDYGSSVEEIDIRLRDVSTSIMLSIQRLVELQVDSVSEETDKWLAIVNKQMLTTMRLSNSLIITDRLDELVKFIKASEFDEEKATLVSAVVSYSMPLVSQYYAMVSEILSNVMTNYYKVSRSTYVVCSMLHNLAKDGFCSPEPPSEETKDDNLHDGTGLGDGEGAQNNSNDVEEDEDLLENAQKPNDDQKENDDDQNEDEAIDMEGDMAGKLEDASDQENNEEQEGDEEGKDMDEEIDDIDEDDPNALDDKMWNEEAPENSKEKESENMPDNSAADDVQASKEEDSNGNKDNEEKPTDKENIEDAQEIGNTEENSDGDSENEEDVGEQEDQVTNEQNEELGANVPEVETMDLPDDMNLDSGEEQGESNESEGEEFDDKMDVDEEDEGQKNEDRIGDNDSDVEEHVDPDQDIEINDEDTNLENENMEEDHQDGADSNENEELDDEECSDNLMDEDNLEEKSKEKCGEMASNEDIQAVENFDAVNDENINPEAAVQQQSGSKGKGADAADEQEQEDVGSSGVADLHENQKAQNEEINDSSRKEATESLKQLGDSLKEFHRRHQEIQKASSNDESQQSEENSNTKPDEFEHISGAQTNLETQALDTANKDEVTTFDEDKAIDDIFEDVKEDTKPDLGDLADIADEDTKDNELPQDVDATEQNSTKTKNSFIQEGRSWEEADPMLVDSALDIEENDLDELTENLNNEVKDEIVEIIPRRSVEESRELWKQSELATDELVAVLSEQLRLILEPTLMTKLRGDYKTGKRLNMKRIIPYIASQFRKDKIWLRRAKPSKRQYQIMIAVDNSKSMSESKSVDLAFQSICLVSKALTQLESGGLSIVKFGEDTKELHSFNNQFGTESGAKVFQWFDFQDTKTDVRRLVAESIKIFDHARASQDNNLWQLQIIISDGVCEDHATIQLLVRRAREKKIMLVFVIVDGINSKESIVDMSQVKYVPDEFGTMQLTVEKYLDTFPFEFYVVVRDISELPEMLAIILRQYFSELASL
ncbi:AAA family ATPase midasin Ecym_4273 [Eremothecium cymbalariae DBVPG|uniref:Midasin n=1 Tax=Eremothecium cymbalariae (strain CBS 270.75 / DBVPG 7215 / KCTC 17166 / NRRL Y-17582) TaxID=931890 RepID=G8JTI4_ERECY|nr:hypothetical protein Ecym_4273 [Eremothecium cymbalariae DBVPG\